MIEVSNLTKRFGRRTVLDNLSMRMEPHVYGLLGQNGSGKTTLIRCLTMIYPEGEKAVSLDGAQAGTSAAFLKQIGYLPQKFGLYGELSVTDMLKLLGSLKGLSAHDVAEGIPDVLSLVNLTNRASSKVKSLSGGMIRRLGIAQALLGNPRILFFDEPTAGLDPEERLRFKILIEEIKANRIIVISTHIVEDVDATCDRILILHDGKIQAEGTNKDVRNLAEGKVYDLQLDRIHELEKPYYYYKKYERQGEVRIRALSPAPQSLRSCQPEIEDGYLCTIKNI